MMNVLTAVHGMRYCAALSGDLVFKVICLAEVRKESLGIRSHQTACRRGHWRICIGPRVDCLHIRYANHRRLTPVRIGLQLRTRESPQASG